MIFKVIGFLEGCKEYNYTDGELRVKTTPEHFAKFEDDFGISFHDCWESLTDEEKLYVTHPTVLPVGGAESYYVESKEAVNLPGTVIFDAELIRVMPYDLTLKEILDKLLSK